MMDVANKQAGTKPSFPAHNTYLDVRSLLPKHHADRVDVLRLAHERRGDVVHAVHQTKVLEVIDVLRYGVTEVRWGGGGGYGRKTWDEKSMMLMLNPLVFDDVDVDVSVTVTMCCRLLLR